ncbi:MAG TPA: SUMF1/EgtB/PvdO family nonheme iron enzyme [Pyrinomonadaceae bacterium]|jgi:formylglycine-generating enzyme required for sulfatase activity
MSSSAVQLCPKCGATARAGWKFCGKCRAPLPQSQQEPGGHLTQAQAAAPPDGISALQSCSTCRQPVEEGGSFCENCGSQIVSPAAPRSTVSQPPQPNTASSTVQQVKETPSFAGTVDGVQVASGTVLPEKPETPDEAQGKPTAEPATARGDATPTATLPRSIRADDGRANVAKLDDLYKDLAPAVELRDEPRNKKWFILSGALLLLITVAVFGKFYLGSAPPGVKTASTSSSASTAATNPAASIPEGMVFVAGESFRMGRVDGDEYERPEHLVSVKSFYLDAYEVTCEQYAKYMKATGAPPPPTWREGEFAPSDARLPVTGVSWIEANAYARWAGKRLPTEEEWELAARGTDARRYPWGDEWRSDAANAGDHSAGRMVEVGSYPAGRSPSGAFDMIGNAWEWTASDFKPYPGADVKPSATHKEEKVIRGGYWGSRPGFATATYRTGWGARGEQDYSNTSFRCALDAAASDAPGR